MSNLLNPGKYVVAVSGGVDSVALLHMLAKENSELVVAHFDHGIRLGSAEDAEFVKGLAEKMDLKFYTKREELGPDASEATARKHRYDFLRKVLAETDYDAIVTAHHQDDLIETALLNVLRGTKRKGLVSLKSTEEIKRPLLNISKEEIIKYAQDNNLEWREDSTNQDTRYRRNEIRQLIKNSLTQNIRQKLVALLKNVEENDKQIEEIISQYINEKSLNKAQLNKMQKEEAKEIVAGWLRQNEVSFDKNTLERIVEGAKKLDNGSQIDVQQNYYCLLESQQIVLKQRESV